MSLARRLSAPLLLTALLPAQYRGEPPPLIRAPTPDARFDPARYNAGHLHCLSIVPERRGMVVDDYIAFSHGVNGAPPRIGAARRDRGSNAVLALSDFDAITQPGDDWVQMVDPTTAVVGNAGVYSLVLRLTGAGSWNQRRTITGLPVGFRKPALYLSEGVLHVMGCTPTTVWDYEIDPTFATVANGTSFTPTLGPGSDLECVTPIVDPEFAGGHWHGSLLSANQAGDGGQVVYHSPSLAGFVINQSLREVMQTADPFTSVSQHRGGTLIATLRGRGIPVGFDTLLNGDRRFPSGGGLLATALPERQPNGPEAFVVLALGIQAPGPIPVPGFANRLGLDAGLLIVIGAQQIPNSADTAAFGVTFPRLPPGSVIAMEAALVWLIAANYFSNNSEILM